MKIAAGERGDEKSTQQKSIVVSQ